MFLGWGWWFGMGWDLVYGTWHVGGVVGVYGVVSSSFFIDLENDLDKYDSLLLIIKFLVWDILQWVEIWLADRYLVATA